MEHNNPLLTENQNSHRFMTIGEIMLRLTPPNYEKVRMASSFEASYGGSEANIPHPPTGNLLSGDRLRNPRQQSDL